MAFRIHRREASGASRPSHPIRGIRPGTRLSGSHFYWRFGVDPLQNGA